MHICTRRGSLFASQPRPDSEDEDEVDIGQFYKLRIIGNWINWILHHDGWMDLQIDVSFVDQIRKDEEEKRSNLIGEEGLPSILKQATTKSNHDDIWHQIPSYTTTLSLTSKE